MSAEKAKKIGEYCADCVHLRETTRRNVPTDECIAVAATSDERCAATMRLFVDLLWPVVDCAQQDTSWEYVGVCTMVSALAHQCARYGVIVDWMSDPQLQHHCQGCFYHSVTLLLA